MYALAIVLSIICLCPLFLYLVRKIKDPFHPLIFAGTLFYFICAHRVFTENVHLVEVLPEALYNAYLIASILSVVGLYAGWYWCVRRERKMSPRPVVVHDYHAGLLMCFATLFAGLATTVHFVFYEQYELTGWIRDWSALWITAAIICVQVSIVSAQHRIWAVLVLLIALAPPVDRFLVYGQRGDTFRLAMLVAVAYITLRRRPSKAVFIVAATILALTLATLQLTREIVDDGEATNRFTALAEVIPHFFKRDVVRVDTGEELVFGSAAIASTRSTERYGYGLSWTAGLLVRLLPRPLVPDKYRYFADLAAYDPASIYSAAGVTISSGAAPSGTASGFAELGWLCFIPWILLGYGYRKLWTWSTQRHELFYQALFAGYTMAVLYAISQDLSTAEVNLLYVMLPIPLAYRIARQPKQIESPAQLQPVN
jgi:hypothetical protein